MKKSIVPLFAALSLVGSVGVAEAYYQGGWYTDNNIGGDEILYLGDNSDDTYRQFRGTRHACGQRGSSYATMRQVISSEHNQITWWIDQSCGDYVRVCVQNSRGRSACSTYRDYGW